MKDYEEKGDICWMCHRNSLSYSDSFISGYIINSLYPLCDNCHKRIHKCSTLDKANKMLHSFHYKKTTKKNKKRIYRKLADMEKDKLYHQNQAVRLKSCFRS